MMRKFWLAAAALLALATAAEAKTLRWGAGREIGSLDPYSFGETFTLSVLNHVYEGLVRYTGDLKIEPALAQSWPRRGSRCCSMRGRRRAGRVNWPRSSSPATVRKSPRSRAGLGRESR